MIELKKISVSTPSKKVIVDNVSLDITPGKLTAIVGKNGAGKSSVLKALCGDVQKSSGTILFEGKTMDEINLGELARRRAVMTQKTNIEFSFSAREIVGIGRTPFSGVFTSLKDEKIILKCMEKADALHLKDQSFTTLSGGEQQRVHFARALAQIWDAIEAKTPSYLLLDEPLASLDVAHQHEMMFILKQICKQNVGVLIVIHDLNLAAQYADVVHILKDGKTVAHGSPYEVFTEEIVTKAFDYPVSVIPHPKIQCPLIVASNTAS